ncbi:MAG: HPr family phosphocarrier protein [Candidatus Firestonebacteria bacterium]|nr:HPr family phosphocarrier protein [Candidatus Firestonebacteria bacterium]
MPKEIQEVKINNPQGVHLRVAANVVEMCKESQSRVSLSCKNCRHADACSVLSVLMLGAAQGDSVTITAEGEDAKEIVGKLTDYFNDGGGI